MNIFNINGLQAISTLHTTSSDNQFYYAIINTVQDDVNDTAICKLQVIDDLTKTEGWNTVQLELNDQTKKNELYKAIAVDLEVKIIAVYLFLKL